MLPGTARTAQEKATCKPAPRTRGSIAEGSHVQYVNGSAEFAAAPRARCANAWRRRPPRPAGVRSRSHSWRSSKAQPRRTCCAAAADRGLSDFGESYLQEALREDCGTAGSRAHLALHRPPAGQQDAPHRGALRLGARARSPADRRAARRTAPLPRAAAERVPAGEPRPAKRSKGGVAPRQLPALAAAVAALPRLKLRGLMCLPPPEERAARASAHWFARAARAAGTAERRAAAASTRSRWA